MYRLTSIVTILTIITGILPVTTIAQDVEPAFFDIPETSEYFAAGQYLKGIGLVQGKDDGKFYPQETLTRAAALKMLVKTLMNDADLTIDTSEFSDIAKGEWYQPYVAWARKQNVIDGKALGKKEFKGADSITKAAFLKILTKAHKADLNVVDDIDASIARDVTDPEQWFYPYMRYAVYSSTIQLETDGNLQPGRLLTRGDALLMMYYYLNFKENKRATALAKQAQFELEASSQLFNGNQGKSQETLYQAVFASVRARLTARGANDTLENSARSRAAVNITTAWHYILNGFLVVNYYTDYDKGLALAQEAWKLADEARTIDPGVEELAQLVMNDASTLAAEIRKAKGEE
jgi:hypothetical protein